MSQEPQDTTKTGSEKLLELRKIAVNLILLNDSIYYNDFKMQEPIKERYFGKYSQHASLFNEGNSFANHKKAVHPRELGRLANLIGDIHTQLRHGFISSLPTLDEDALKPETAALLKEFHAFLRSYRKTILDTRKREDGSIDDTLLPHWTKIPLDVRLNIDAVAAKLCKRINESELGVSDTIPVKAGDESIRVKNTNQFGLVLFALNMSKFSQIDANLLPYNVEQFITGHAGIAGGIVENAIKKYHEFPELMEIFNQACEKTHRNILQILRQPENIRAMQMAALCSTHCIDNLVRDLGATELPERLETPLEAAVILETVKGYLIEQRKLQLIPPVAALAEACVGLQDGTITRLDTPMMSQAEQILNTFSDEYAAVPLLKDFFARQRLKQASIRSVDERGAGRM